LSDFQENPDISKPLKNIFCLHGERTDEDIKNILNKVTDDHNYRFQLKKQLSKIATTHINSVWKEHKINIKIEIEQDRCYVVVEDRGMEDISYDMNSRSDGFKQFISFILAVSAQNESKNLSNSIIILDEPEIHLHPSGVRFMRDELLKIGKNNYVFVATHSHYMIDTETAERHIIVEKDKVTKIHPLTNDSDLTSDEVLSKAFGISLMKELLPQNILIVEGGGDKKLIEHILKLVYPHLRFAIKSAGGSSKISQVACILKNEKISSYIIFDADEEGRKKKEEILKTMKPHYDKTNTFTLKDLVTDLPENSTIEDLMPFHMVNEFFKCELTKDLNDKEAIMFQLTKQKIEKEKKESLKVKLSEEVIQRLSSKELIEEKAPRLTALASKIKELFEKEHSVN
jgi:predicted ATP-dependent endonuclease of OLD family